MNTVTLPAQKNGLKIGQRFIAVAGLGDAVAAWGAFRDRMMQEGLGSSDMPSVTCCVDKKCYRISWNGAVWDGNKEVPL